MAALPQYFGLSWIVFPADSPFFGLDYFQFPIVTAALPGAAVLDVLHFSDVLDELHFDDVVDRMGFQDVLDVVRQP